MSSASGRPFGHRALPRAGVDDKARRDHCVDKSQWRLTTRPFNRAHQGDGAKYGHKLDIDPSFTSALADGGIKNAKRIDGRPFLDKDDKAIT